MTRELAVLPSGQRALEPQSFKPMVELVLAHVTLVTVR